MLEYNEISPFLDQYVDVGVNHRYIPGKIFWFYGKLIQINNLYVKLRIKEGYKVVAIEDIIQIHLRRGRI